MVMPRVMPCLDVAGDRVVKGVRFQHLRDAGSPTERARAYETQGADELVVLDISATIEERAHALETIRAIRKVLGIPLTVGGGVRTRDDASRLLDAGADRVAVNSAAVARPGLVDELARAFGSQCTVVSIDARRVETVDDWRVMVRAGSEITPLSVPTWSREAESRGAGEILLTSWDRDGTQDGYDLDLLAAVGSTVSLPLVASGGVGSPDHLVEGARAGASGLLIASILHDERETVDTLKHALRAAGVKVRP